MDDADLRELDAAIGAHAEWLTSKGVTLPAAPEELWAHDVKNFAMDVNDPGATAVVTSLRALCALRTRAKIRELRVDARRKAREEVNQAPPEARTAVLERAERLELLTDDEHYRRLTPSLKQLEERLRTAGRKLETFQADLRRRHRAFVRVGAEHASGYRVDAALTRWVRMHCDALEADLEFFAGEIEGFVATPHIGHPGPADGKAWHRVRGEALLILGQAGVKAEVRRSLFPGSFAATKDPDEKRQQRNRDQKARERAKKRRIPDS